MKNIYFYVIGAHSRARTLAAYILYLYPETRVCAYLVNNEEKNPGRIDGIPVIKLNRETKLNGNYPVFIGTRSVYHEELETAARKLGLVQIYPVTPDLDSKLRNAYLRKYFAETGVEFVKIEDVQLKENIRGNSSNACVYTVKSIFDKPLLKPMDLAWYERLIQAGAALTEERLEENGVTDAQGENISYKNKQYCELTALYWIWKHAKEDIVGLVHYRRHFLLPEDWIKRMEQGGIDVILPVPLYVAPSVGENYRERHIVSDWDFMMGYLKQRDSGEYEKAVQVFQNNLYSPCNMFIMRRKILDELCTWMFPVIDAAAVYGGKREDVYQNRYPGFLAERLMTLFFEMHRDRYGVAYADKNFLV